MNEPPQPPSSQVVTTSQNDGFWSSFARVLMHATDRGQVVQVGVLGILGLLVYRLDSESSKELVFKLVDLFQNYHFLGWLLLVVVVIVWYLHVRWMRRVHMEELARMANERNLVQENVLGAGLIQSSKK